MLVLAHLSDIHLAPLPVPRPAELLSKRGLGFINWLRKRRAIHRPEVLAALVADLKAQAPGHIAVTGDLVNLSLSNEFAPARAWLERLGTPGDVTFVPGNHDAYVRGGRRPGEAGVARLHVRRRAARPFRSCAGAVRWRWSGYRRRFRRCRWPRPENSAKASCSGSARCSTRSAAKGCSARC